LIALIALHLAAILFYTHVKKEQLVKPMITGWKDIQSGQGESARGGGMIAIIVALVIALAAVYGGSGAWLSIAPPVPATTPAAASW